MRNKRLIIAVIVVAILILLNLPISVSVRFKDGSQDSVAPFQRAVGFVADRGRKVFQPLRDSKKARVELEEMREENAKLRFEVQMLKAFERENRELREQLAFTSRQDRHLAMCRVLSRGGSGGWWQTVRLDKGRKHGLRSDLAVITADGLIGRTGGVGQDGEEGVLSIGEVTCDVLLITDPNCRVACRFLRTGALGILRGMGVTTAGDTKLEMLCASNPCRMDYIGKDAEIRVGDEAVTSGLGGVFPEGLLVGHVAKVEMDQSGLYQRAEVIPAARMDEIQHVFVVVEGAEPEGRRGPRNGESPGEPAAPSVTNRPPVSARGGEG